MKSFILAPIKSVIRAFLLLLGLTFLACSTSTSEKTDQKNPSTYLQQITIKEYATKLIYGELEQDSLEYYYIETFQPNSHLEKSITLFGYNPETEKNEWLNDTLRYTSKATDTRIEYYVDEQLSEIEVRKENFIYVYDIEIASQPMLIRKLDSIGNIILEASINGERLFVRNYSPTQKDSTGHFTKATSNWSEYQLQPNSNLNNFSTEGLQKIDSAIFMVEFEYLFNLLNP